MSDPLLDQLQPNTPAIAATEEVAATGSFITILEDPKAIFPWQYTDPDTGITAATVFQLRLIPDETNKAFRKRHITVSWKNGQRREDLDGDGYGDDLIDYAIVDWTDLYAARKNKDGQTERFAVGCERRYKVGLPEKLKGEIIRLCLGKELGAALGK